MNLLISYRTPSLGSSINYFPPYIIHIILVPTFIK